MEEIIIQKSDIPEFWKIIQGKADAKDLLFITGKYPLHQLLNWLSEKYCPAAKEVRITFVMEDEK